MSTTVCSPRISSMRSKGGYWRRPTSRTYMYNLDVGEHYYHPMTSYLEAERGTRGETPGALTFDERLQRNWLHGRRYEASEARERYARSSSLARESNSKGFEPSALRMARAASEVATTATASQAQAASATASKAQMVASSMSASRQQASSQQTSVKASRSVEDTSVQKKSSVAAQKQDIRKSTAVTAAASKASAASAASAASSKRVQIESSRKIDDDISKKIADIHITPFSKGKETEDANAASARARLRILELERELEEITKKAMLTQTKALKTAKQMAAEAYAADESAMKSSSKRSKKVIIESNAKIN